MAPNTDSSPTFDQAWHMLSFLRDQKASAAQLQNFFGAGDLLAQMLHTDLSKVDRAAFAALLAPWPADSIARIVTSVTLSIDHNPGVGAVIVAGRYNGHIHPAITDANFPHRRNGVEPDVTIHLVEFSSTGITTAREAVLQSFGDPADMDDMLAVGAQFPGLQRRYPVIFFGASWSKPHGGREVGYLNGDTKFRDCGLYWANPTAQWETSCVFAVRARK